MEHVITVAGTGQRTVVPFTALEIQAVENAKKLSKPQLKEFAASKRWAVETSGCPWNGFVVSTDRESQSKLIAVFVAMGAGLRSDGETWKFDDGVFRPLSNAEAQHMIATSLTHIKTAFAVEASVLADIESETITNTDQVLAAAWPANS